MILRAYIGKQGAASITGFTGIDDPDQPVARSEILIDTQTSPPVEWVRQIVVYLEGKWDIWLPEL